MALSGLHVTCGFIGIKAGAALLAASSWSQTMAAAATTDLGAREPGRPPSQSYDALLLAFEVYSPADAFVAVGTAPDAAQISGTTSSSARVFVPGGQTRNVFCNSGDKLAWVAA